ncbi:serine hydrolase [Saccharothrix australiensis]|uniref:Beta-lactamase family protein n=1 Tax=Saccharothrix australiensis TaxID=2072 RepID=A0A495VU04_9PSEU|nr:serine hydrolase [Saccharothrix australiensis]RKT52856.1 beta-lactamase family protein [Saccharothrix australiensis]
MGPRVRRTSIFTAVAAVTGALVLAPGTAAATTGVSARLAEQVRQAVVAQDFKDVIDLTPPGGATAARSGAPEKYDSTPAEPAARVAPAAGKPLHQTPNLDVAVIELDGAGRPTAMADVLLSPQHPKGVVVPVDRRTLSTDQVRYRWWDDTEWDVNGGRGTRDVLAGREGAPIDFSSPYPASVLKLMVGFGVLRLVDQGRVALDGEYAYAPVTQNPACGGPATKTVRRYFDEMITKSQNESTCALIKMLHDLSAIDELNRSFADLGMPTLMITGTNPGNGGRWIGSNMSGIDTAKLLLLVNGGPGTLWTTDSGARVTRDALSQASRRFFAKTLGEQGHNEMLSTTNWCGRAYPAPGIPQLTPRRWVNPADGTVTVGGAVYGQDVRPCDAAAEVTYAHKNGWVDTTGSDAGIVHSLRGKAKRNYIVVVFGNLGTDYVDVHRPADPPGVYPVPYTEKYGKLGLAIDRIVTGLRR